MIQSLGLMRWGNIGQGYVRMTDCCSTYSDGNWTDSKSIGRLSSHKSTKRHSTKTGDAEKLREIFIPAEE